MIGYINSSLRKGNNLGWLGLFLFSVLFFSSLTTADLQPYLHTPTEAITVVKGELFNISTGVTCTTGQCSNIVAKLDPIKVGSVEVPSEVYDEISDTGYANVIIIFEDESGKKVNMFNIQRTKKESLKEKKVKVKATQDEFLAKINPEVKSNLNKKFFSLFSIDTDNFKVRNKYSVINGMAGRINQKGLEILENQTNIKAIVPVQEVKINLRESVPMVNSDSVWYLGPNNTEYMGQGQAVCVVDTGIRPTHEGFGDRILAQRCYCAVDGGCCPGGLSISNDATDDQGHGTHCSGIVAGDYGSYKGVAPKAGIVSVKALNSAGSGFSSDIISGIDWCVANSLNYNISVISLSLGGGTRYNTDCDASSPGFAQAISDAVAQDIFVAVASGNDADSTGISSPACVSDAFSVGAVYDTNYASIGFSSCSDSNTFPDMITCFSNRAINLDIMAPGGGIQSMGHTGDTDISQSFGTSQAAPHVAGAAILLKEFYKKKYGYNIKPAEIGEKLKGTSKPLFDSASNLHYPRMNLDYVLEKGVIPEFSDWNGVDPFYTISSNPAQDSCLGSLAFEESCVSTWAVNSTQTGTFEFFTIYEMGTEQVFTQRFNVTVIDGFSLVEAVDFINNTYVNPEFLDFRFNITSSFNVEFCDLIINDEYIARKNSPDKGVIETITATSFKGGVLNWRISCYDSNDDLFSSEIKQINVTMLTEFDGDTTDLTNENLSNISNLIIEKSLLGKIDFQESINLERGIDLNSVVKIENNKITVDSKLAPELNKSARLTLKQISFTNPVILRNDIFCDECVILDNQNNEIIFSVNQFSSYTVSENARLEIYDSTENQIFDVGEDITFYANFTNVTDSEPISSANCTITFEDDMNLYQMSYDGGSKLYSFTKNFAEKGVFVFEVSCNATAQGYSLLATEDWYQIGQGVVLARGGYYTHSNFSMGMNSMEWSLYFGRVNQSFSMKDNEGNIAYEWDQEITPTMMLASRHELVFDDVICANSSVMVDEEQKLGIDNVAINSISATFGLANHPQFNVTNLIPANMCNTTHLNVNSSEQSSVFKEIALYDNVNGGMVYGSFIYDSIIGFDGNLHDYQIILPVNSTSGQSSYNIYVII